MNKEDRKNTGASVPAARELNKPEKPVWTRSGQGADLTTMSGLPSPRVESAIWTSRMSAALRRGVKGGKRFGLIDKIYSVPALEEAWESVRANKGAAGIDKQTVEGLEKGRDANLRRIAGRLKEGSCRPQAVKRVWIDKPGSKDKRPLGIPTVADRIVQSAVRHAMEPIFEQTFARHSYGFRPGRGCKDALSRVQDPIKRGYRHVVDVHLMEESGFEMVRYADDFVVMCRDEEQARRALEAVSRWTGENKLVLHPEKTRLVDLNGIREGFDFLGYRFTSRNRWPRQKSMTKVKDTIRKKTKRTSGRCMGAIVTDLNKTLRGWFEYFQHSSKSTMSTLDGYIRGRLRSILRKRNKRKGRGRGADRQRWPNAYFEKLGLYSLTEARAERRRSA